MYGASGLFDLGPLQFEERYRAEKAATNDEGASLASAEHAFVHQGTRGCTVLQVPCGDRLSQTHNWCTQPQRDKH